MHFQEQVGGPLMLASFPGSGNTWARILIQEATRVYTGSIYHDESLVDYFKGERVRYSSVSVVKTHFPCPQCWGNVGRLSSGFKKNNIGAIFILRNPFDAFVADFKRRNAQNHTGNVDPSIFLTQEWKEFVIKRTDIWTQHTKYYLHSKVQGRRWLDEKGKPAFLIYYENLVHDFENEIKLMMHEIHLRPNEMSTEETTYCAILQHRNRTMGEKFHRKKPEKNIQAFSQIQKRAACHIFEFEHIWQTAIWGKCY